MIWLVVSIYAVGLVVSWFLITGWTFAHFSRKFPGDEKGDMLFTLAFSAFSLVWPVSLPTIWCATGFAEYGWRPVWGKKS